MKSIRELLELIPEHILDMDLAQTFLVGLTTTDIHVQVDRLNEMGAVSGKLSDDDALKVLHVLADNFDPEVGLSNELVRNVVVDLVVKKEVALV